MNHDTAVLIVEIERAYQLAKWGDDAGKGWPHFLLVLQGELQEAIDAWQSAGDLEGRREMVREMAQVAAVALAAITAHIPDLEMRHLVRVYTPPGGMIKAALADGRVAQRAGFSVLGCFHHDAGTREWASWVAGWVEAMQEAIDFDPPNE